MVAAEVRMGGAGGGGWGQVRGGGGGGGGRGRTSAAAEAGAAGQRRQGRAARTTGRCRRVEPGDGETTVHGWKIRWGRWAGGLFGLPWVFLFHSRPTSFLFFSSLFRVYGEVYVLYCTA